MLYVYGVIWYTPLYLAALVTHTNWSSAVTGVGGNKKISTLVVISSQSLLSAFLSLSNNMYIFVYLSIICSLCLLLSLSLSFALYLHPSLFFHLSLALSFFHSLTLSFYVCFPITCGLFSVLNLTGPTTAKGAFLVKYNSSYYCTDNGGVSRTRLSYVNIKLWSI